MERERKKELDHHYVHSWNAIHVEKSMLQWVSFPLCFLPSIRRHRLTLLVSDCNLIYHFFSPTRLEQTLTHTHLFLPFNGIWWWCTHSHFLPWVWYNRPDWLIWCERICRTRRYTIHLKKWWLFDCMRKWLLMVVLCIFLKWKTINLAWAGRDRKDRPTERTSYARKWRRVTRNDRNTRKWSEDKRTTRKDLNELTHHSSSRTPCHQVMIIILSILSLWLSPSRFWEFSWQGRQQIIIIWIEGLWQTLISSRSLFHLNSLPIERGKNHQAVSVCECQVEKSKVSRHSFPGNSRKMNDSKCNLLLTHCHFFSKRGGKKVDEDAECWHESTLGGGSFKSHRKRVWRVKKATREQLTLLAVKDKKRFSTSEKW